MNVTITAVKATFFSAGLWPLGPAQLPLLALASRSAEKGGGDRSQVLRAVGGVWAAAAGDDGCDARNSTVAADGSH